MNTIIPRWEWRAFGDDLGAAAPKFAALATRRSSRATRSISSPPHGDANVKIRDGLLDIKQLEETDGDGLEQWRPVLKAGFPLPAATLTQVFAALSLPAPALSRYAYSQDEMVSELAVLEPLLRIIAVHKERTRFRVAGCMSELTRVDAVGRTVQTLAVESEDAASVLALVHRLGLIGVPNQSYPRGLKALAGMGGTAWIPTGCGAP